MLFQGEGICLDRVHNEKDHQRNHERNHERKKSHSHELVDWSNSSVDIGAAVHLFTKDKIKRDTCTMRGKKKAEAQPTTVFVAIVLTLLTVLAIIYLYYKWDAIGHYLSSLFLS